MNLERNIIIAGALFFGLIGLYFIKPFYILDPGYTAIQVRLGNIKSVHREGGLYFKIPFIDSVVQMPNGINKAEIETSSLSKDLQPIAIGISVNYRYVNEVELYKSTRGDAENIILIPFCHESIKAILAQYTAEDLIQNRHEVKEKIYSDLKERLKPHYIEFIEVNFSHADFSGEFIHAIESKQIAIQEALRMKNKTDTIREESIQTKLSADAEAYSQQVKKQSVTKELIALKAIEKWDGVLPKYMTGSVPFIKMEE